MKTKLFLSLFVTLLSACATVEIPDELVKKSAAKSVATFSTRSTTTGSDKQPPLPIHLYIFDKNEACVAMETLTAANEDYNIELIAGTYEAYALAGATAELYNLPSEATASPDSKIELKQTSDTHAALEMGNAGSTINILPIEEATRCDITVKNIFALLNVELTNMPLETKTITVTISNLCTDIHLDGELTGSNGSATVNCTYDNATSMWQSPLTQIFPGLTDSKPQITVQITNSKDEVTTINATGTRPPQSNHPYNLNLTYAKGTLSGNISSSDWEEPIEENITITPDGEQGGEEEGDNPPTDTTIPTAGTVWNDCLVLSVTNETELLLMSTEEWTITDRSEIAGIIEEYEQTDAKINGWRMISDGDEDALSAVLVNLSLLELNKALTAAGATPLSITTPTDGYILKQEGKVITFREGSCKLGIGNVSKRMRLITTHTIIN